jgi:hypothetical protein
MSRRAETAYKTKFRGELAPVCVRVRTGRQHNEAQGSGDIVNAAVV